MVVHLIAAQGKTAQESDKLEIEKPQVLRYYLARNKASCTMRSQVNRHGMTSRHFVGKFPYIWSADDGRYPQIYNFTTFCREVAGWLHKGPAASDKKKGRLLSPFVKTVNTDSRTVLCLISLMPVHNGTNCMTGFPPH